MWTTGVQGFDTLPSEQFPCHELRQLKEWSLPARRGKGGGTSEKRVRLCNSKIFPTESNQVGGLEHEFYFP